jgi:hypothetical protein
LTRPARPGETFDVASRRGVAAQRAAVVLATSLLLGCAEVSLRAPDVNLRQAKLVFAPSMVALYRIEGCDLPFDDWRSKAGRIKVDSSLRYYAATAHARMADLHEVTGTEVTAARFYELMNAVTLAMYADRGSKPLSAWTLGPTLATWADALHADYLVFVAVRGSIVLSAPQGCEGKFRDPLRWAGLTVVELATGRIVRFRATRFSAEGEPQYGEAIGRVMEMLDLPVSKAAE